MMERNEMPIGFTMSLSMDLQALNHYAQLPKETQDQIISYVSQPGEGMEPKRRIEDVIQKLHDRMY